MLVGGTPIDRTGGKPMRASSAATTMSQWRARSVPPARQLPCTWAMTGMVQSQTRGPAGGQLEHGGHVTFDAGRAHGVAGLQVIGQDPVSRGERPTGAADHHHPDVGICLGGGDGAEQLTDAAGGERVVAVPAVEGQPAHRPDPFDQDGRALRGHRSGAAPAIGGRPGLSSSPTTTLPAAFLGRTSTICRARGTL